MIHPTAIVDPKAKIASDAEVGPYSVIGPHVTIGPGNILHSHVVIQGRTTLGEKNQIYPFVVLGTPAQDFKDQGGDCRLEIGSHNLIREHVSVHLPNSPREKTKIGDHNFLMGASHVGHNCELGNHIVLTQGGTLGGHVRVEDHVVIGGHAGVHQFVRIGRYAMVGGKAAVAEDVPPFAKVFGIPARFVGINRVALERGSFGPEIIRQIFRAFELLYASDGSLDQAVQRIKREFPKGEEVAHLIKFLQESQRGICSP